MEGRGGGDGDAGAGAEATGRRGSSEGGEEALGFKAVGGSVWIVGEVGATDKSWGLRGPGARAGDIWLCCHRPTSSRPNLRTARQPARAKFFLEFPA